MSLRDRARRLRVEQTDAERRLWSRLRDRQVFAAKFRRQHAVGPFITDFCCPERRLVIELDGSQHATRRNADARRTDYLERQGYRVLRFWDREVLREIDGVLARIVEALGAEGLSGVDSVSSPPPRGRGQGEGEERERSELDIRDEVCPYTFLKAKLALEPLAPGQLLRVVVGNETSARDVPRSLGDAGHTVLAVEPLGASLWAVTVRKKPDAPAPERSAS